MTTATAPEIAVRYANWSISRLFPWHFTCPDRYAKTTLCGRTMKTYAEWSRARPPDRIGNEVPRYCVECVDVLCSMVSGKASA